MKPLFNRLSHERSRKNEIKRLSDRLDAIRHQQADLSLVEAADKYAELEKEKATLETRLNACVKSRMKLSKEAQKLMSCRSAARSPKNRPIWAS
jgi:ribosome-associated protein